MRLQIMLLKLQKYSLNVVYKRGQELFIADALSRVEWPRETTDTDQDNFSVIHLITDSLDIINLSDLKEATRHDPVIQLLKDVTLQGWPNNKMLVPQDIHSYWSFRD